jgi:peptide/nickel transport system permease protein
MASLVSKEKRIIYLRKIKNFWEEYRRNKIGLVGLAIVSLYVIVALTAPWLTPYHPLLDSSLAQNFAMPEWITILPEYRDIARTMKIPVYWSVSEKSDIIEVRWGREVVINYRGDTEETARVYLTSKFDYPYGPPNVFRAELTWAALTAKNVSYSLALSIVSTNGTEYSLWQTSLDKEGSGNVFVNSRTIEELGQNLASEIFSEKGEYTLWLYITFTPLSPEAKCEIRVTNSIFTILGRVHGLLGTEEYGRDVFSQLIHGAKISLIIGLSAAIISTVIGVAVGVASGYIGGIFDEFTMRIVDILLCLPVLPLILAFMYVFKTKSVLYIIFLVAIFWWLGLSRVIRSQTLSIREMPFVECARASGAGRLYIMFRHIVPNVLPFAFAFMVLAVPSAILLEAALSFLGFGDPLSTTWGRMLDRAFISGAFKRLAWWWIFPPGLAIVFLCLGFVFIGHAVDEIVNPRLRRRR